MSENQWKTLKSVFAYRLVCKITYSIVCGVVCSHSGFARVLEAVSHRNPGLLLRIWFQLLWCVCVSPEKGLEMCLQYHNKSFFFEPFTISLPMSRSMLCAMWEPIGGGGRQKRWRGVGGRPRGQDGIEERMCGVSLRSMLYFRWEIRRISHTKA